MEAWQPDALVWLQVTRHVGLREAMALGRRLGLVIGRRDAHNLIVTTGKQLTGDMLIAADTLGLTYFAFGTGTATPLISDTILAAEVGRGPFAQKSAWRKGGGIR